MKKYSLVIDEKQNQILVHARFCVKIYYLNSHISFELYSSVSVQPAVFIPTECMIYPSAPSRRTSLETK